MIPYLLIILVIFLIAVFAEKRNKKKEWILSCVLIIILSSLFAGVRDYTVGTDVSVYVLPIIKTMKVNGFLITLNSAKIDLGFLILSWLVLYFNGNIQVMLFIIHLIITTLFVIFAYKKREKLCFSNAVLFFMTFLYPLGFNFIRQTIAISICIYAYRFIEERDFKKFFLCILISSQFHFTSLCFIFVYLYYWFGNRGKYNLFIKYVFLSILLIFILFFKEIFEMGLNIGIIPLKYTNYLNVFYMDSIDVQYKVYFFKILFAFCGIFYASKISEKNNKSTVIFLVIMDLFLYTLGFKIMYAERITYYFSTIAYLYGYSWKKNSEKYQDKLLICLFLILYFLVMYVYTGIGHIIPYRIYF